jgi:hypothetical protein
VLAALRGEPRRIGHKRLRPSFETRAKGALLRMRPVRNDGRSQSVTVLILRSGHLAASRRMGCTSSWFETREDALLTMRRALVILPPAQFVERIIPL